MYKKHTIAVIVPAYNEEKLIGQVIQTMPNFVDKIIIVDDHSRDNTPNIINQYQDSYRKRLLLIRHNKNEGVGGAIVTGYKWAKKYNYDISVVMAGDAQMDPSDLEAVISPVILNNADYAKGNRLSTRKNSKRIPIIRNIGIRFLSALTKIVSGFKHINDSQCGYTALHNRMLHLIDLDKVYKKFGMPNDFLVRLNTLNARVVDVPVKAIYNIGEKSDIRYTRDIPLILFLLAKLFIWRMLLRPNIQAIPSTFSIDWKGSLQS